MKTRKFGKIAAALLSLVLMLSTLSMSVFAHTTTGPTFDGTASGSLTINKTDGAGNAITDTTLQYTIYKVAEVSQTNVSGVVTMEYILANNITLNSGAITGDGSTVAVPTGTTASSFDVANLPTGTTLTNTAGTGTLSFTGLPLGLYLVRETNTPAGVSVANDFLVSIPQSTVVGGNQVWDYDPIASPKNTVVDGTVSKTVTGGATATGATNTWTASLGDTIAYAITAKLPTTFKITPYTTYTVKDIPATGLDIDLHAGTPGSFNGIVVKVGATTLIKGTDYTITASGTGFVVELITAQPTVPSGGTVATTPGTQSASLTDGAIVTISYNAKLSPTATGNSFTNSVQVDSKYNTPGGSITPPSITPPTTNPPPTIVTYNYALQKVDDDNSNAPLAGAIFAIRNTVSGNYLAWTSAGGWADATGLSDPNLYKVTSATGATNGIVSFKGLAGTIATKVEYEIVEISAPAGYSALTAPITVTIGATSTSDADIIGGGTGYSMQVVNSKANTFTLPGTGGMGIYIYTIGGVLLIGTAILLFTLNRKRKNSLSA